MERKQWKFEDNPLEQLADYQSAHVCEKTKVREGTTWNDYQQQCTTRNVEVQLEIWICTKE